MEGERQTLKTMGDIVEKLKDGPGRLPGNAGFLIQTLAGGVLKNPLDGNGNPLEREIPYPPYPLVEPVEKPHRGGSDASAAARFRVLAVIPVSEPTKAGGFDGIHFYAFCFFVSSFGCL